MLVTFGLGSPSLIPTFGLGVGITAAGATTITVGLRQNVIATDEFRPLVGSHAKRLGETVQDIRGWHFDRRRYIDEEDIRTSNPGQIGNITDGFSDGTVLEHWLSGIGAGQDCDVVKIVQNLHDTLSKWSPVVNAGEYFSHITNYYLFGDGHVVQASISGYAEDFDVETDSVELDFVPDSNSPIVVGIYRRESSGEAFPWRVADLVPSFMGTILSAGVRAETINDDGTPNYSNVDSFARWEVYVDTNTNKLYFNKNMASLFGTLTPLSMSELELVGTGTGTGGQRYFTQYFPVDPGVIGSAITYKHILYVNGVQWTLADDNDLSLHAAIDQVYSFDFDLGMISFGGTVIDATLYLANSLDIDDDEIVLLGDVDLLPDRGVLLIDSEKVSYLGKTATGIVQVTRGHAGTTAAVHSQYSVVEHVTAGAMPASGDEIRVGYYTTPRIEYTITDASLFTTGDDVNLKPSNVPEGNGIVYISRKPVSLSSLVLEVDKPLISGSLYGPVTLGADFALLTATAYGPGGVPVARIPITIEQTSSPPFVGLLNGGQTDYTSISNYSGEITSSYVVGSDTSAIFVNAESVVQDSGTTLVTISGDSTDFSLDELFIYVITKDDPMIGTVGLLCTYDPTSLSITDLLPGSNQKLTVTTLVDAPTITASNIYPDDVFNGGEIEIYKTDGTTVTGTIKYWRDGVVYIAESLVIVDADIDFVILKKSSWAEWNPSTLNGKRRVLYEYNPNVINPVTDDLGAYFPIQPISSSYNSTTNKTTFVFDTLLALPDANDVTNNVGGYMLTLPRKVSFRAKATDPFSGMVLVSNTLELKLFVPDYLNGVYLSESGRIPYGFRVRDETLEAASGLDGAVFVTINPVAGSYGAVSNPFASLLHFISVG